MNEQNNLPAAAPTTALGSPFSSPGSFETGQRMATALSSSEIVPAAYKKNVANCLVALEIAQRTGNSIMAVMQSLHVIQGKPSWSSSWIIAAVNSCGRFEPLRFRLEGNGMAKSCVAWTRDSSGTLVEGPAVSMEMAKAEGWIDKPGSKWKTMPDLMLRYRAAAFFGRLYAPDLMLGMQSQEEVEDITVLADGTKVVTPRQSTNQRIAARRAAKAAEPAPAPAPAADPAPAQPAQPDLPTVTAEVVTEPAPAKKAAPKPKEVIL